MSFRDIVRGVLAVFAGMQAANFERPAHRTGLSCIAADTSEISGDVKAGLPVKARPQPKPPPALAE